MKRSKVVLMGGLLVTAMISSGAFAQRIGKPAERAGRPAAEAVRDFAKRTGIPDAKVPELEHQVTLRKNAGVSLRAALAASAIFVGGSSVTATSVENFNKAASIVAPEAISEQAAVDQVSSLMNRRITEACGLGAGAETKASIPAGVGGKISAETLVGDVVTSLKPLNEILARNDYLPDQSEVLEWVMKIDGSGDQVAMGIDRYSHILQGHLKALDETQFIKMSRQQLQDYTWSKVQPEISPAIESTVAEALATKDPAFEKEVVLVDHESMPQLKGKVADASEITVAELRKFLRDEDFREVLVRDAEGKFRRSCHTRFI